MKNIAILGSTSYVAKGVIECLSRNEEYQLYAFSRKRHSQSPLQNVIYDSLYEIEYKYQDVNFDVVINFVKTRDLNSYEIFTLSECIDSECLSILKRNPDNLYINISSGAVYNRYGDRVIDNMTSTIDIDNIKQEDAYYISKIYQETKHRFLKDYNIIDIRLFSYFSKDIDLNSHYFLAQAIKCIRDKVPFVTSGVSIVRDFIHPFDLSQLIECCIYTSGNDFFDSYSLSPISKFEILWYLKEEFGLEHIIDDTITIETQTKEKELYYPMNKKAQLIGYKPIFTSLETIQDQIREIIK